MKKLYPDNIIDTIDELILKQCKDVYDDVEIKLSCCPPFIDKIDMEGSASEDIDFNFYSLRKMVSEYISERDGGIDIKHEIDWLDQWAKEFESYAKRLRKHSKKLSDKNFKPE